MCDFLIYTLISWTVILDITSHCCTPYHKERLTSLPVISRYPHESPIAYVCALQVRVYTMMSYSIEWFLIPFITMLHPVSWEIVNIWPLSHITYVSSVDLCPHAVCPCSKLPLLPTLRLLAYGQCCPDSGILVGQRWPE